MYMNTVKHCIQRYHWFCTSYQLSLYINADIYTGDLFKVHCKVIAVLLTSLHRHYWSASNDYAPLKAVDTICNYSQ